ncbi:unnamed protein product [Brugia pahangi]|uniref:Uncharacterized protein n=1 Tax=Brugia pahangi TaxID=6280 RepID=A0A0N4TWB5_BRUPA|nr:unnamed protein product [Brugia pahangi]
MDDNNDQMMHSTDTELLSSEEEFEYSTNQQSTISFSAISNLFLNSCYYYYDLFMQQLITQSLSNQLSLQHLTAIPLLQLAEIEQLINSQLIRSEYSQLITSSQFIRELLNSTLWDQWLCILAKLLTPNQWQLYWMNYLMQFGTVGLPQHLINFFATATSTANLNFTSNSVLALQMMKEANWMHLQQQFYVF